MKVEINTLIERLELERDDSRVAKRLKLTDEIESNEIATHECMGKLDRLRNRWREGLQGQKIVLAEKNPIVFFGDLLTKREADLEDVDFRIAKLDVIPSLCRGNTRRSCLRWRSWNARSKA
jgi:hypothetical protein